MGPHGGSGAFGFDVELAKPWDTRTFVLDTAAGAILEARIEGPGDGLFRVSGPCRLLLEVDDGYTGIESGEAELLVDGTYFLQVEMLSGESSTFDLISAIRVRPFHDPDDGRTIAVGLRRLHYKLSSGCSYCKHAGVVAFPIGACGGFRSCRPPRDEA